MFTVDGKFEETSLATQKIQDGQDFSYTHQVSSNVKW